MMDGAQARLEENEADLEQVVAASVTLAGAAGNASETERTDYFATRNGVTFAGTHVIIDLWGCDEAILADPVAIERALVAAARDAGATVLSTDFHHFQPNGGVSGVVVLAESHISIHTWPERAFAAVDVFMCGDCEPAQTIPTLEMAFSPNRIDVNELRRGVVGRSDSF